MRTVSNASIVLSIDDAIRAPSESTHASSHEPIRLRAVVLSNTYSLQGMAMEGQVRALFMVLCVLAAIGPGIAAIRLLRGRSFARTFTDYGPLPEIPFGWRHWVVLIAASLLIAAVLLEISRARDAPMLSLIPLGMLWLYIGPGVWERVVGDGTFEPAPGLRTMVTWQMMLYQVGASLCALWLVRLRYWAE